MKELERRVLVLESNITKLNAQKEKAIDFSKSWGDTVLQIDGDVIGRVALKQLNKMQKQGGITLITV